LKGAELEVVEVTNVEVDIAVEDIATKTTGRAKALVDVFVGTILR
jgi:hypothetical protein